MPTSKKTPSYTSWPNAVSDTYRAWRVLEARHKMMKAHKALDYAKKANDGWEEYDDRSRTTRWMPSKSTPDIIRSISQDYENAQTNYQTKLEHATLSYLRKQAVYVQADLPQRKVFEESVQKQMPAPSSNPKDSYSESSDRTVLGTAIVSLMSMGTFASIVYAAVQQPLPNPLLKFCKILLTAGIYYFVDRAVSFKNFIRDDVAPILLDIQKSVGRTLNLRAPFEVFEDSN